MTQDGMTAVLFCGLINFMIWLIWVVYFVRIKMPVYHPIFLVLLYHLMGFVLRPFNIYSLDGSFLWDRIGLYPTSNEIWLTCLVVNLSLSMIAIGFIVKNGVNVKITRIEWREIIVNDKKSFYLSIFILTLFGYYATYKSLFGANLDTVLAYKTQLDASGGQQLDGISGYVTALAEFLPIVCILLAITSKNRIITFLYISTFILIRFYAGAQRLSFVVVLLALFFLYLIKKEKLFPSFKVVVLVICFLSIFDIIGNDRYAFRKIVMEDVSVESIIDSYIDNRGGNLFTSDIVEFDVASSTIAAVDRYSAYTYGSQYLRLFIWPIPRQLWSDKPVLTSIINLNEYGNFLYLTTSLYADVYMTLGLASTVAMLFSLGWFIAYVYNLALSSVNVITYMFFWTFLIYIKTIMRDGGVTVIYFWFFSMMAVWLVSAFGKLQFKETEDR